MLPTVPPTIQQAGEGASALAHRARARPTPQSAGAARVQALLEHLLAVEELAPAGRARLEGAFWGGSPAVRTLADVQWLFALLGRKGPTDYPAGPARRYADAAATR